jgi:hypothetical protein
MDVNGNEVNQVAEGVRWKEVLRGAGRGAALYTAALVANTAVPVWHEPRQVLPFLAIFRAGFQSAASADDTVFPQRARIAAGHSRGAARADPRVAPSRRGSPATALDG